MRSARGGCNIVMMILAMYAQIDVEAQTRNTPGSADFSRPGAILGTYGNHREPTGRLMSALPRRSHTR